ncbi:class I SAM-dependent methyltransferase [Rhizobium sp. TRM95796]|uniref:class I SAM-dependent methyltransferase n=1 Tax=Rhizobium sp. TRM95796 TaxID=2979862 RepID=UPI0021E7AAEB|nr:class I SAM-dependent methyltransferase [Rhizobium sp. TRM95796]MCV3766903.1 class I SAM-dependent methyltransferase [Rhizobium sp. TRM95796]
MTRDAVKTLFHPFVIDMLTPPIDGERTLFLGAETGYDLPEGFCPNILAVQPFKPLYEALKRRGVNVQAEVEGDGYDYVLILMSRHRGANENSVVDALRRSNPGARIVLAGAKEDGSQSLRKRLNGLGVETEHLAKHHAQAFWFTRPDDIAPLAAALSTPDVVVEGKFVTAPGMFSHAEVDAGSRFLARYLPEGYRKAVADFGAGWGYLSDALLQKSPGVERVDLYEADFASLAAARRNLTAVGSASNVRFFWHDLAREEVKHHYDLIIMNPPFHEGHATEPGLGQTFIKTAAKALKGGGELLLVANRGLPYESLLAELFKSSEEVARNARYKVLKARR